MPTTATFAGASNRRPHSTGRRGAALAELAIVISFLAFALLATVDFARAFHYSQIVQESARSGALLASGAAYRLPGTTPDDAAREAAVAAGAGLSPPVLTSDVAVTLNDDDVSVTVTYGFRTMIPYPGIPQTTILKRTVSLPISPSDPRWN